MNFFKILFSFRPRNVFTTGWGRRPFVPSGMRYKYTKAYVWVLLACVVLFLITLIVCKGQSSDVVENVKESLATETTSLNIEQWLMKQDQNYLKDTFAKAGIWYYMLYLELTFNYNIYIYTV